MEQRAVGGVYLFEIGQHISMGQHRPFRYAGGAAGILQKRQIFRDDFGFNILHAVARLQGPAEGDSIWQVIFGYQPLNVFDDEVHQRTLRGGELIAHPRQDHVFDLSFVHHFFQRVGKVRDDNNRRRTAVIQLVLQLTWGIERVDVNYDHACAQNAKQRDRVLQQVWHHQCHPIPFL